MYSASAVTKINSRYMHSLRQGRAFLNDQISVNNESNIHLAQINEQNEQKQNSGYKYLLNGGDLNPMQYFN